MSTIYGRKAKTGTNWLTAIVMIAFHIGAIAAFFFFSWPAFLTMVAFWWVAYGWGIGMGYHRLLTHRGYTTPLWVEHFLTLCATLALEGGPIFWVATHRIHHQKSDREGDPHSPRDGKWWSHMGWILSGQSMHHDTTVLKKYVPDLAKDPFHVKMTNWHWIPLVVSGLALLAVGLVTGGIYGAISFVTWGVFFRVVFGLHWTWAVNSATHLWGSRRFKTRDDSTNLWWVAMFTFGEGWHNNHHAHPTSARHGLAWYEFDINWLSISFLKLIGLAKDVRVAKLNQTLGVAPLPGSGRDVAPDADLAGVATAAAYD